MAGIYELVNDHKYGSDTSRKPTDSQKIMNLLSILTDKWMILWKFDI